MSFLGLEIFQNYQTNRNMHMRASNLSNFGKRAAILIDHDEVTDSNQTTEARIKEAKNTGDVLVWSRKSILDGATGCDLEVILAKETPVAILATLLKSIYVEARDEHEIDEREWTKAKKPLRANHPLASQVPAEFPNPGSYPFENLKEPVARLTFLCLMHGPHSIKTARDMRRLAELLGTNLPAAVLNLYDQLRARLANVTSDPKHVCYDLYEQIVF